MFVKESWRNEQSLEDFPYMFSTKFQFIWESGFRGEDFLEINQSEKRMACGERLVILSRSVNKHGRYRPFLFLIGWFLKNLLLWNRLAKWIKTSYQISVHLRKWFQRRRFFRNQLIKNKNSLWWLCLLTDRNEMSNLYRTFQGCFLPSFDSFGRAVSEEKIF
jgi:hypothetical protein